LDTATRNRHEQVQCDQTLEEVIPMTITLITGTSSGIGKATALHLASCGHKVYATMQSMDQHQALVDEASVRNLSVEIIALDVDKEESVQSAIAEVLRREGRI